ncbi:MAG TPA: hypothetical protein VGV39_04550 [Mesorhizobium sp.]|jgi:hypothetical protein|uniref:DUF7940 domain-containing protein n=1 Tax=Mesorhizobium sp. TaxID=1871066 RepID=UPI002DDD818F|nr:hypothetical protein [Mesorhizobium sp.]HEV2502318.1 hypothetical protein [Mesorhizobium sp.]
MRLVTNWRAVLRYAWTVRLALLAAILNGLAITVSIITGALPVPPLWLAALNGLLAVALSVVRIIEQANLKDTGDE